MYAMWSTLSRSLTATMATSLRLAAARNTVRPIRPKPLIPIFIMMRLLPLTDRFQHVGEPRRADVERFAPLDPRKLDGPELPLAVLVVPDDAGLATQAALDGEVDHGLDELQIFRVRSRRTGEVAALL